MDYMIYTCLFILIVFKIVPNDISQYKAAVIVNLQSVKSQRPSAGRWKSLKGL